MDWKDESKHAFPLEEELLVWTLCIFPGVNFTELYAPVDLLTTCFDIYLEAVSILHGNVKSPSNFYFRYYSQVDYIFIMVPQGIFEVKNKGICPCIILKWH
jgi:hypothetical protein